MDLPITPFAGRLEPGSFDGLLYLPRLLRAHLERRRSASRTAFELQQLSDRDLADIGIAREDIPAVVRRIPLQRLTA